MPNKISKKGENDTAQKFKAQLKNQLKISNTLGILGNISIQNVEYVTRILYVLKVKRKEEIEAKKFGKKVI